MNGTSLSDALSAYGLKPDWSKSKTRINSKNQTVLGVQLGKTSSSALELNIIKTNNVVYGVIKRYITLKDNSIYLKFYSLDGKLLKKGVYDPINRKFSAVHTVPPNINLFAKTLENVNIYSAKLQTVATLASPKRLAIVDKSKDPTSDFDDGDEATDPDNGIPLHEVEIPGTRPPIVIDMPFTPPPNPWDNPPSDMPPGNDPAPTFPTDPVSGNDSGNTNPDIKNKTTDPCISKTVDAALNANKNIEGIMAKIISNFADNKTVSINVYNGETANNRPGQTTHIKTISGNVISADITLQTSFFQQSSKESLAAVLIHEFIHAYIKDGGMTILNSPHDEIASKYIDPMASYLNLAYNISLRDAYALAWSGVPDSKAYSDSEADTPFKMTDGNIITKSDIGNISAQYNDGYMGTSICK